MGSGCLNESAGASLLQKSGKEFYGYALHIVSIFDEMEKKIRNWDTLGTVRSVASITIGTHILPPLLKSYQALYPDLRTEVNIRQSAAIEQQIVDNETDIGAHRDSANHPDIVSLPFMEDSLCPIVSTDHPLTEYRKITLEQLAEYPFLML